MDKKSDLEQEWKNYKVRSIFASPLILGSFIFTIAIVVYLEFSEPFSNEKSELITKVDKKLTETIQEIEEKKTSEVKEIKEKNVVVEKTQESELVNKVDKKLIETIKEIEENKLNEIKKIEKSNERSKIAVKKEIVFTPDLSYELRLIKKKKEGMVKWE